MTNPVHSIPTLSPDRLNQMINTALAQPQLPAIRERSRIGTWIASLFEDSVRPLRVATVTAALLVLVLAVTVQTPLPTRTAAGADADAFTEVSDLITLDLLENLS